EAEERAAEMERLVSFGQALGRSLDMPSIRDVVLQHLPRLTGTDDAWVLLRERGHWEPLGEPSGFERQPEVHAARARVADRAIVGDGPWTPSVSGGARTPVSATDGHLCFALTAGGHSVGVLGMPQPAAAIGASRQRMLATSAALLAIAIRNAQLFQEVRENS